MRSRYRSRREALVSALAERIPGARIEGIPAGVFALVSLNGRQDPVAIASAAAELGVAVQPAEGTQSALVLGYANLTEPAIEREWRCWPRPFAHNQAVDLGLTERACIVTGGSRGIGRATALSLAVEGAHVLVVGRDRMALTEAAGACSAAGAQADLLVLDITGRDAGERLVEACLDRFGRLDVLVNNAGTSALRPLDQLTDEDWQAQWELHVMAPMRAMRAAAPVMAEREWGRIVNVSSSFGQATVKYQYGLFGDQGRCSVPVAGVRRSLRRPGGARQCGHAGTGGRRPVAGSRGAGRPNGGGPGDEPGSGPGSGRPAHPARPHGPGR